MQEPVHYSFKDGHPLASSFHPLAILVIPDPFPYLFLHWEPRVHQGSWEFDKTQLGGPLPCWRPPLRSLLFTQCLGQGVATVL